MKKSENESEEYGNEYNNCINNCINNDGSYSNAVYVTVGLIVINIIVFIIMSLYGNTLDSEFMAKHGAMYPKYILEDREYWRIFTSIFLHFGLMHLVNNMIVLGAAGRIAEKAMGHIRFLIMYFFAGAAGSIVSMFVMINKGDFAVSAGASGAIFGIVGALIWIIISNKGSYAGITRNEIVFMAALMIYFGIAATGVDNWAHAGGLLGGFLISIVLYRKKIYN